MSSNFTEQATTNACKQTRKRLNRKQNKTDNTKLKGQNNNGTDNKTTST
jgi:hypothetical protein